MSYTFVCEDVPTVSSAGRGLCHTSRSGPPTRTPGRSRDSRHQTRTTSTPCQRRSPRRRRPRQLEWRRSLRRRRGPCTRTQILSTGTLPPRAASCTVVEPMKKASSRRKPPGAPRRRRSWQRCSPHQTSHGSGRWVRGRGQGGKGRGVHVARGVGGGEVSSACFAGTHIRTQLLGVIYACSHWEKGL